MSASSDARLAFSPWRGARTREPLRIDPASAARFPKSVIPIPNDRFKRLGIWGIGNPVVVVVQGRVAGFQVPQIPKNRFPFFQTRPLAPAGFH